MENQTSDNTLAVMSELRLQGKLCDVVLQVGDVKFNAHKIILCSCSLYFRTLFTGAWATSVKQTYTIPGVSPEMMHIIINYAYTHSVPVTAKNVVAVLAAADQFLVPGMIQTCCSFLEGQLCLKNCISIWRLGNIYNCPEFSHKVFFYVLHHFEDIVSISQEFLDLSAHQIAAMIENDHLNIKQENVVLKIVLQWINHLPDQRQDHLFMLLSRVRLGLLTVDYLRNKLMNNPMIKNCPEYASIINDAWEAHTNFHIKRHRHSLASNRMCRPRLPPVSLLVTGGRGDTFAPKGFELYDTRSDCWANLGKYISIAYHGAAVLHGYLYIVGGCGPRAHLNTLQRFDFSTYTWEHMASMHISRSHLSVAVQNGCIYAMGGFNGFVYLNTVECYNPKYNQWTMRESMHARRCGASATSLHGMVYICGGFNGFYNIATAESYNPETNQWTMICPMHSCRANLGVVAYKDKIYAVGGTYNWNAQLRTAEAYNPRTNRWHMVPSMYNHRSNFGIEVVEDQLFVVGGENRFGCLSNVECYDEEAGRWYYVSQIEAPRRGLSCCLLHGLQNLMEELFPRGSLMLPSRKKSKRGSPV
ncbi:kelch-like protein 10 [Melanotaenia boesemani]|uniref:kelch-like protein 10 n=1 Tax=Melanotaenia boesemani TaxID=1250792 RepID=UPI001C04E4E7|nr:kelch-like protein 10 [Melanotaenia boesemani]